MHLQGGLLCTWQLPGLVGRRATCLMSTGFNVLRSDLVSHAGTCRYQQTSWMLQRQQRRQQRQQQQPQQPQRRRQREPVLTHENCAERCDSYLHFSCEGTLIVTMQNVATQMS